MADSAEGPLAASPHQPLLDLLRESGLRRLDAPIQLASGAWSSDFIDAKAALAEWAHLRLACESIVTAVGGHAFDAVGGPTMGANALSVGIAAVADLRWFFVRKVPKQRGTRRWIEGTQLGLGDSVLMVEDVVTTGRSLLAAVDVVERHGARVPAAAALVDRSRIASQEFARRGIAYYPMVTYQTLGIEPVEAVPAYR